MPTSAPPRSPRNSQFKSRHSAPFPVLITRADNVADNAADDAEGGQLEDRPEYVGLEIFRAGTHTDSAGNTKTWTQADLDELVESYDPANFRAPLIVSHDIDGHFAKPDAEGDDAAKHQSLLLKNLAFGYPAFLEREGDSLMAYFEKISPVAIEWIKNGSITGISSSIYFADAPTNPSPGKLSLRHIALLGVDPPAVKGMALDLAEGIPEGAFEFSLPASEEGAADFYAWAPTGDQVYALLNSHRAAAEVLSRLRDHLIAQEGEDVAEAVIPRELMQQLQTTANQGYPGEVMVVEGRDLDDLEARLLSQMNALWKEIESCLPQQAFAPLYQSSQERNMLTNPDEQIAQPGANAGADSTSTSAGGTGGQSGDQGGTPGGATSPEPQVTADDMREMREEIERLKQDRNGLVAQLREQQVTASRAEWRATVADLKLPAAITNGHAAPSLPGIAEHEEGAPYTLADFGASLTKSQAAWFKAHLESIGGIYKTLHEELTPADPDPSGGKELSPEELAQKADEYVAKQKAKGIEVTFPDALSYVEAQLS